MKPTSNRLLVRVIEQAKAKKGETPIPATSVMHAEVLKVGPAVKDIWTGLMVVFAPYGMDEIVENGEKLIIINEDLILATYEQKPNTKTKG